MRRKYRCHAQWLKITTASDPSAFSWSRNTSPGAVVAQHWKYRGEICSPVSLDRVSGRASVIENGRPP